MEIKDLYKTLNLSIMFDNKKAWDDFYYSVFFDIQMTLEGKPVLNVYNRHDVDYESIIIRFQTLPMKKALDLIETLIADPRYVGIKYLREERNQNGSLQVGEQDTLDVYRLSASEVAVLRSLRNKLLELASYS